MKYRLNYQNIRMILIIVLISIASPLNADDSEITTKLSCEDTVKHHEQSLIEYENELNQVRKELDEERKVRKELQDQLDALTELEENINGRETLINNN